MYGQLSFKAIIVGLLVKFFAGAFLGGIVGGVAGGLWAASTARGGVNGLAANNPAQMTQAMTGLFTSPLFLIGSLLSAVLAALLAGYITGILAPGSEMKNAAVAVAIFIGWTLITSLGGFLAPPAGPAAVLASSVAPLLWMSFLGQILSVPAYFGGAALAARRIAPAPRYDDYPQQ